MRLIAALLLLTSTFAYSQKDNGYKIDVKLKDSKDTACYMAYYFGTKKYVKDTARMVKPDHFVFEGEKELPGGIYIIYFPDKLNFEILVNEQNFSIEVNKKDMMGGITFKGSEENTLFYDYLDFANQKSRDLKPLQNAMKKLQDRDDQSAKDSMELLRKELKKIDDDITAYRDKIVEEHPNKLISNNFKALKEVEVPKIPEDLDSSQARVFPYRYTKKHYWDNIDFSNDNILRTPIYETKLNKYFEKMTLQLPDSIIKECDLVVGKAKANKEMFKFTVITLTNKYGKSKIMGLDEVFVHMIENYYSDGQAFWLDSAGLYRLQDRARTLKYTLVGRTTPNITMKDTNDVYRVLHNECVADFNILVFWDPDCGHCKKEVPKWNRQYENLKKDYSIRMIGITTTSLKGKWMKFIRSKKLQEWLHLYDPDYKSPFRQYYDITSTPKVYIIDNNNKVIAKQLGADQIEDFIKRKTKQKELEEKRSNK